MMTVHVPSSIFKVLQLASMYSDIIVMLLSRGEQERTTRFASEALAQAINWWVIGIYLKAIEHVSGK